MLFGSASEIYALEVPGSIYSFELNFPSFCWVKRVNWAKIILKKQKNFFYLLTITSNILIIFADNVINHFG